MIEYSLIFNSRLNSQNFEYLGQIQPAESDDLSKFNEAIQCLGFGEKQQDLIYRIVAAILHAGLIEQNKLINNINLILFFLGNIEFAQIDEEQCAIPMEDQHIETFCKLLSKKKKRFITRKIY